VYGLSEHINEEEALETTKLLHKTIAKVTSDIHTYKFNTAISALMIFVNHVEKSGVSKESYKTFLTLLAPFAPHLTEELWTEVGETESIHIASWPKPDESILKDDTVILSVQINGKMRGTLEIPLDSSEEDVIKQLNASPEFAEKIKGTLTRVIYVKNKIINLIIKAA
jgi:leucyl-tRNA synthetase